MLSGSDLKNKYVMKVVILAAGEGKRMFPLTVTQPKPLLKIRGKAILEYIFEALPKEADEVYLVVRYLGEQIREFLVGKFLDKKIYFVDGSDKGSAYSLLAVKPFIGEKESFMVINGDDLPTKQEVHDCGQHSSCILVCQSAEPESCGIIELAKDGTVSHILEKPSKPPSRSAVGGIIVVTGKIFSFQPSPSSINGEFFVSSLLNQYLKEIPTYPVYTGACRQFSSPSDLDDISRMISQR